MTKQERIREIQKPEQDTITQYVVNAEGKTRRFEWGLDPIARERVLPQRLQTYDKVVDTALDRKVADARRI